jgi:lipopolysaccharide export LptBFGC system permease protein LptF
MTDMPAVADAPERHEHRLELLKEGFTTALYVAVCLLAALIALPETGGAHEHVIRIIWGITIGLALVVLDESAELAAVELVLAAFIGLVGFGVARGAARAAQCRWSTRSSCSSPHF